MDNYEICYMKIILFSSAAVSVCLFRLPFVDMLLKSGCQVIAVVGEGTPEQCATIESIGVPCYCLGLNRTGMNPLVDVIVLMRLCRLLRTFEYDHLMCYAHKAAIYGMFAHRRKAKCWVMLSGLGYAFTGNSAKRRFVRWLFGRVYPRLWSRCDGLLLLNPDDKANLLDLGIISQRPEVCVLPGEGVPLSDFTFSPVLAPQAPRFLMISRLLVDKGVCEYAASARIIRGQYPQAEFHLVGPIDLNPTAIPVAEIQHWETEGIIQYHGSQSDVRPFLCECTVYVLPSYREGTPRTVLEAMATGRAVITTDAPGCRETVFGVENGRRTAEDGQRRTDTSEDCHSILKGENGFLVPVKSVEALVAAMRRFIADPELAVTMGKAGRRLAEEHYDVHKVNQQMMEFMGLVPKEPVNK